MKSPRVREPFYGWRMVALAFVAYNCGLTVVINSFGPALPVLERELGASRAGVSLAFGLLMLSMGLVAPLVGHLTRWVRLRTLMMTGSALHVLGFLLLAYARTLTEILLVYGLLLGAGMCLMAIISAPTLISRWFDRDRGKALGIGLVQVFALVTAPLAAWLLTLGGRTLLFLALAGLFAVLTPVMSLVIDRPDDVGQAPRRPLKSDGGQAATAPSRTSREILMDRRFWLLCLALGIYSASGITFASHGPAMAIAKGVSLTKSSTVLSGTGAGTLIGAVGFGWLIDRIGSTHALIWALVLTAVMWLVFSQVSALPVMIAVAVVMGACMGPMSALSSACISDLFGASNFGRVLGYSYLVKIPFMFGPAVLAGRLYDVSGGYGSTYAVVVTSLVVAALLAAVLAFEHRRRTETGRTRQDHLTVHRSP